MYGREREKKSALFVAIVPKLFWDKEMKIEGDAPCLDIFFRAIRSGQPLGEVTISKIRVKFSER